MSTEFPTAWRSKGCFACLQPGAVHRISRWSSILEQEFWPIFSLVTISVGNVDVSAGKTILCMKAAHLTWTTWLYQIWLQDLDHSVAGIDFSSFFSQGLIGFHRSRRSMCGAAAMPFFWLLAFYLTQAWLWLFIRTLALLCGFFGRFFPLPCRYSRSTWNWKTYHGAASPFAAMFSCSCHSLSISFLWLPGCIHLQDPGPHRSSSQHFCRLCRSRGLDPHDSDPARCVYLVCLVQGCCCPQLGTNPSDFVLWKYQLCSFSAWTHHFRCFSLLFGFDSSIGLAHNLGMIGPQGSRIAFTAWWKKLPAALRPRKIQHPLGRSHCTVGLLGSVCFPYWQDIGSWSTPSLARLRMSAGADNFTATSRKKNTSGPPGSGA